MTSVRNPLGERGMSESVQWTLAGSAFLLALLGCLEFVLWLNARTVVTNAALAGAEAQSQLAAGPGVADAVARRISERGGVTDIQIQTATNATTLYVTVSARGDTLVGWRDTTVTASASRPIQGTP